MSESSSSPGDLLSRESSLRIKAEKELEELQNKKGDTRMDTQPTSTQESPAARSCCVPAHDRSGRDKPRGHDGPHWTYGGNTLTWPATTAATNEASDGAPAAVALRALILGWCKEWVEK